jgi:hypothetical protein
MSSVLLFSLAGYSFALPCKDVGFSLVKFDVNYQLWTEPVLNPDYNVTETWIFDWVNGIDLNGDYSPAVSMAASSNSVPVPEPGDMIALGVFLIVMVAVSRKRFLTKK